VADACRGGDGGVACRARVAGDEAPIELDGVKVDAAQVCQRLGTSEVVDNQSDPRTGEYA